MKHSRTLFLMISAFLFSVMVMIQAAVAELFTPNLQGTWEYSLALVDEEWTGETSHETAKGIGYIYQKDFASNVPNLLLTSEADPDNPFQGIVQGRKFSFYKINHHGEPNVGREIITGEIDKGSGVKLLRGQGVVFGSNSEWGTVWSYNLLLKKISDEVP